MNMKAAASLTGSLLARKGAAYPAAYSAPSNTSNPAAPGSDEGTEPQRAYNDPRVIASAPPPPEAAPQPQEAAPQPQEADPQPQEAAQQPEASPPPEAPADHAPQMQDGRFFTEAPQAAGPSGSDPAALPQDGSPDGLTLPQVMDKMGRVRLSVRLDPDRYLRVKMASARTRWSAQDIVIAALDRYLSGASDDKAAGHGDVDDRDDEDSVN
ncbi:MAG: hypothetical protein JSU82_09200 [Rhodospirillales bacterium]|nr:MAG: hypothetical protein JSU82_09200 [Rhodospirillales bacterium]